MGLFKTMKGLSKNFTKEKVPFKDGYVYLTPDNERLYMDSAYKDEDGNDREKRIQINKNIDVKVDDLEPETLIFTKNYDDEIN